MVGALGNGLGVHGKAGRIDGQVVRELVPPPPLNPPDSVVECSAPGPPVAAELFFNQIVQIADLGHAPDVENEARLAGQNAAVIESECARNLKKR